MIRKLHFTLLAPLLLVAAALPGCSGESAPTVGDAEIAKGISYGEMPKPSSPAAVQAAERYKTMKSNRP